eukprot:COSAG01_NODE_45554_length_408_cov_1.168285_2_plen_57_part_01
MPIFSAHPVEAVFHAFNLLIELIQGVESEEQLKQLKQLPLLRGACAGAPRAQGVGNV